MHICTIRIKAGVVLALLTIVLITGILLIDSADFIGAFAPKTPVAPAVLIDAGHGGLDGGAVSSEGLLEAPINLAISVKLRDLLVFLGVNAMLTRTDAQSLNFNPEQSIRANKVADLNARLKLSEANPGCDFLSIHLNQFPQKKYSGAQVFYSENNPDSQSLALEIQKSFRAVIDPANNRDIKKAPEAVFLMKKLACPAVTVECGFLSNQQEAALLAQEPYQTKLALAIAAGYLNYLE